MKTILTFVLFFVFLLVAFAAGKVIFDILDKFVNQLIMIISYSVVVVN